MQDLLQKEMRERLHLKEQERHIWYLCKAIERNSRYKERKPGKEEVNKITGT